MSDFDPFGTPSPAPGPGAAESQAPVSSSWDDVVVGMSGAPSGDNARIHGADPASPPHPVGRILVVCTGNVCRSPYIERTLRAALGSAGFDITSAGTGALVDHPIDPGSQRLLDERGIAHEDFRARQLEPAMVREADLVLTATREHRSEVVRAAKTGLDKTFALLDFADLVRDFSQADLAWAKGENPCRRVVETARQHRPKVHMRVDGVDIPDPFRQGPREFAAMQVATDPAVATVADALLRAVSRPSE